MKRLIVRSSLERGSEVLTPGVDYESRVTFVARNGDTVVIHTSSGTHWSGIGQRGSHPATFIVFRVASEVNDGTWITMEVVELIEFTTQNRSKK